MYSDLPTPLRLANRGVYALGWAATWASGLFAGLFPPTTVVQVQEPWFTTMWVVLITVSCVPGFLGVLFGWNAVEGVAAWFATAGVAAYMTSVWVLVGATPTRATQAWSLTALTFFVFGRAMAYAAYRYRLNRAKRIAESFE